MPIFLKTSQNQKNRLLAVCPPIYRKITIMPLAVQCNQKSKPSHAGSETGALLLWLLPTDNVQRHVGVTPAVHVGFPDLHEVHLDLLAAPFQAPREGTEGDRFHAHEEDLPP